MPVPLQSNSVKKNEKKRAWEMVKWIDGLLD
jgi:hypothetical protein